MRYTAFLYDGIPYEFTRLPFGTKDSMQGFLAAARKTLEGTEEFVAAYVDDILVFSKTKEEHRKHLEVVFEKINSAGMTLKLKKCKFYQNSVKFLGFIISSEGIKPDPEKVAPIRDFPTPLCTRDVQSFLGIVNYYRNHVPYCADLAQPLSKLTGNAKFEWGEEQQIAFEKLKEAMCNSLLEAHPRFDRKFYIMTDASGYGIGGFIYQLDDEQNPIIINMVSRLLHPAELNYHTYERELLGLVYTLKKCRYMLDGYPIVAFTDQQALSAVYSDFNNSNSRIIRWLLFLQEFNIETISYIPGVDNVIADALSRYFKDCICPHNTYTVPMSSVPVPMLSCNSVTQDLQERIRYEPLTPDNFKVWFDHLPKIQSEDAELSILLDTQKTDRITLHDNLFHIRGRDDRYRIFVPMRARHELIEYYHQDALHPGINKTTDVIRRFFDWPGCRDDVTELIDVCQVCILNKRRRIMPQGEMHHVVATTKNKLLAIDNFGPLPIGRGGMEKILVVMDVFTKFVKLYPVKRATTESSIKALEKYMFQFGIPKTIASDNGSNFTSAEWRAYWTNKQVTLRYTSVYRPASNPVERVMQTLAEAIRMQVHDRNQGIWPTLLTNIEKKINCTEHSTTGVPPILLQCRFKPNIYTNVKPDISVVLF